MKSKFFKDTQGLESAFELCSPEKVSVCLRLSKCAYDYALRQSTLLGFTSGEYMEQLLLCERERDPERLM
ncbi:MAG: hypothetical protein RSA55_02885 [Clostridia bacterium]